MRSAGGIVLRDLFQTDGGGWLEDVVLVERLVAERLQREADGIRAEGWHWIEVAPDFPYGHSFGLRQLRGEDTPLTDAEEAELEALRDEYCALEEAHAHDEGVPDEVDQRLTAIEARVAEFDERPVRFDPGEMARAGAFVSIDRDGRLRVERGYVRPEDERPVAPDPELAKDIPTPPDGAPPPTANPATGRFSVCSADPYRPSAMPMESDDAADDAPIEIAPDMAAEPEEEDGFRPLSDRLMAELTTHRTVALRHALGERPDVAFLAALHALCLKLFYPYTQDTCLELDLRTVRFTAQPPGLSESEPAKAIAARHQDLAARLPRAAEDLWDMLVAAEEATRQRLFAHCVSSAVNAVQESWNRRPKALAHAGQLATAVRLDMAATGGGQQGSSDAAGDTSGGGWTPTVETYLGRVTKARILQAVREARGESVAARIAPLNKGEMAAQAQDLLAGSGWLPEPLRTPGLAVTTQRILAEAGLEQPTRVVPAGVDDPNGEPAEDTTEGWQFAAE